MRKPIIVGNWKMNKNNAETKAFFEAVDGVARMLLMELDVHLLI